MDKRSPSLREIKEDGIVVEQYVMDNSPDSWNEFSYRYLSMKPEIALEVSTTGKYVAISVTLGYTYT
jgi:hypothetical protein